MKNKLKPGDKNIENSIVICKSEREILV
jgi:hypothetical protein